MSISLEHTDTGWKFSWTKGKERLEPTRRTAPRPAPRDMSSGLVANEDMLRGLYHGTWKGLQFASPLAFTPINLPVQMMGLPTPYSEDVATQAMLDQITKIMSARITKLNRAALLFGTAWRWPRYDASLLLPVWDVIPDQSISDILVDIATGRMNALLTSEQITISVGENRTMTPYRKRRFDPRQVIVSWSGERPSGAQDFTAANVSGILPVPFAHDADEDEIRGYSALARIIRDLKDYHDTDFRTSDTLTRFRVKQKQTVKDVGAWLANQGISSVAAIADYEVAETDLILNLPEEDTDFAFLAEGATASLEKALERKYWKIFEGSGIPEMFWGGLATGNHATAEVQMQEAVSYVESIRKELDKSYHDLYSGTLNVMGVAQMRSFQPFEMKWNRLESISADVKSQILLRFAQAVGALASTATFTPTMLHTLWELNFPEAKAGEYEGFLAGLEEMAKHKQLVGMDPFAAADLAEAGMLGGSKDEEGAA